MVLLPVKSVAALITAFSFVPVVEGGGYYNWNKSYLKRDDHDSSKYHGKEKDYHDEKCHTIAEIACNGDYDSLCEAIEEADLYHTLDDKHEEFTAFFPTDHAFDDLLHYLHVDDVRDIPHRTLEDVLLMHVSSGHALSRDDLKHSCSDLLEMENGDDTRTICDRRHYTLNLYQKGSGNPDDDRPKLISFDKEACNGIAHIVDEVILPGYLAPKPKCESITDIACASKDFETLCHALHWTGLDEALDDGSWTVFAPTDDAFHEFLDREHLDSFKDIDEDKLTDLLLYHVVADKELTVDDLECDAHLEMASGEDSTTTCPDNSHNIFQKGPCNRREDHNEPRITEKDVEACNGYIQVVEDVLLPGSFCEATHKPTSKPISHPSPTDPFDCDASTSLASIAEIACAEPSLSTLCAAVTAAGLGDVLGSNGAYTVFAPTNDAFEVLGASKLDELLADPDGELKKILLYHVADEKLFEKDLDCGLELGMLEGDFTTTICDINGKKEQIGNGNVFATWSNFVDTDIETCNGIVHIVDNVLIPS